MSKHKYLEVVTLDVYGTILATNDPDNELPPRTGTIDFLEKCKGLELKVCTCSDADTVNVKIDLREKKIPLKYFDHFFQMQTITPKDFRTIIGHYKIKPSQLLVIGDRLDREIQPALQLGCCAFHVPEYFDEKSPKFDLSRIRL